MQTKDNIHLICVTQIRFIKVILDCTMDSYVLIAFLIVAVSLSVAENPPCPENGCSNFTLYLGPRWGSKLIQYPNYPKIKGPTEQEAKQLFNTTRILTKPLLVQDDSIEESKESEDIVMLGHRPVPDDNSFDIDYADPPIQNDFASINRSNSLLKIANVNELLVEGTLNLTNLGLKGEDIKGILLSLSEDAREGLHRLYLNHNPLVYLYDDLLYEISRLTNLKVLGLSGTSLRVLIPFHHPSLEVLDLSSNSISQLPASYRFNMPNLRELDLSNNDLNALYFSFSNLANLRILSLANNDMSLMSTEALQSLNLQKLYLNNNRFHVLNQIMVDPTTSPDVNVYLSGNPLVCDCYLQENLMNRAWPKVADWDELTCIINSVYEPHLVSAFANECQGILASLKLIPARFESAWNTVYFFLRRHHVPYPDDVMIYSGLLVAILLVWLAFRIRNRRLKKDNVMSSSKDTVPYTILDSKQVP